jgi:hypothetical protein
MSAQPSVQPPAGRNEAALIQSLQVADKEKLRVAQPGGGYATEPLQAPVSIGSFETENSIRRKVVELSRLGPLGRANLDNLWREFLRLAQR